MPIRRFLRKIKGANLSTVLNILYSFLYLFVVPVMILIVWYSDTRGRHEETKKNRAAILLIAGSECDRDAVFRRIALRGVTNVKRIDRITDFFNEFGAPLNHALRLLGEKTCQERAAANAKKGPNG